jgi:GNAT superfamily N-acetyltransferase
VSTRIQEYIRTSAPRRRDTARVGPFLATFTPHNDNPYLNYAIPDAGAEPSATEVTGLVAAFRARDLRPRLEYLPGLAPAVEPALLAAGFAVEARLPLMICRPGEAVPQPVPSGVELLAPATDADLLAMLTAQHEAYRELTAPTAADVARTRATLADGGLAVLARDAATGEPAGGGVCDVIAGGAGELAGFGVREAYRRRGVGAAITGFLTAAAHSAGAVDVFLTPGGAPEERIYARAGFRTAGEVLHVSLG